MDRRKTGYTTSSFKHTNLTCACPWLSQAQSATRSRPKASVSCGHAAQCTEARTFASSARRSTSQGRKSLPPAACCCTACCCSCCCSCCCCCCCCSCCRWRHGSSCCRWPDTVSRENEASKDTLLPLKVLSSVVGEALFQHFTHPAHFFQRWSNYKRTGDPFDVNSEAIPLRLSIYAATTYRKYQFAMLQTHIRCCIKHTETTIKTNTNETYTYTYGAGMHTETRGNT